METQGAGPEPVRYQMLRTPLHTKIRREMLHTSTGQILTGTLAPTGTRRQGVLLPSAWLRQPGLGFEPATLRPRARHPTTQTNGTEVTAKPLAEAKGHTRQKGTE